MVRRRVVYSGRVQGVGFRAAARAAMTGRPVSGFVRNEPDGRVLLEAQGEAAAVDAALARFRAVAPGRVDAEDVADAAIVAGEVGFRVDR